MKRCREELEDDLQYQQGFLDSITKRLSSSMFKSAPQSILDNEALKIENTKAKIAELVQQIRKDKIQAVLNS